MTDPYYYDDHIVSDPSASTTNLRGTVCVCVCICVCVCVCVCVGRHCRAVLTCDSHTRTVLLSGHFSNSSALTPHDETRASSYCQNESIMEKK
jgi:hypothetical protein